MAVKRIFVEKRQGFFDIPAQRLCSDLIETFRLTELRAVRIITRYDVEGLSDEDFARVRNIVFADPPVDTVYEDALPSFPTRTSLRLSRCRASLTRRLLRRRNAFSL